MKASNNSQAQTGYAIVSLHLEKIPQRLAMNKDGQEAMNLFAIAARKYSNLKTEFPSRPPLKVLQSMSRVALGMPGLSPAQRDNLYDEIFSVYSPTEPIKGLNGIIADWVASQFVPGRGVTSVDDCFNILKAWGRLDSARIQLALTKAYFSSAKTRDRTAFKNATALIHKLKSLRVTVKAQAYHVFFQAALELNLPSSAQWAATEIHEMGADLPLPLYRAWITKALAEESPQSTIQKDEKHGWSLSAALVTNTPSRLSWKALSTLTFAAARSQNVEVFEPLNEEWMRRTKSATKKWKRESEKIAAHAAENP
jgi:hypothetical protein